MIGARRIALEDARQALEADAVVISGGPHLFTAEPSLIDAFAFIDDLRVPTLGICLGHQAIALRAGAQVFLGPERREAETIHIVQRHPLVDALPKDVTFVADHCEGVTLPDGFVRVASSSHYENEIIACDERRLYGVQFHPEVSGDTGLTLLTSFLHLAKRSSATHG